MDLKEDYSLQRTRELEIISVENIQKRIKWQEHMRHMGSSEKL